jgi:hypothetical protein
VSTGAGRPEDDPVQREQHGEVGHAEVGVVRRRPAHPGAQPQVAAQQRWDDRPGRAGHRREIPGVPRRDTQLARRVMLGTHHVPHPASQDTPVGQRHAGAAGEVGVPGQQQVARDPGPDQADHRAASVVGVDAGAPGLDQGRAQRGERGQVELGVRVQPAGGLGTLRGEHPVGADDLTGVVRPDDQVIAVLVEPVAVQPGSAVVQPRAELAGEHPVAEPFRRFDLNVVPGHEQGVARGRAGSVGRRGAHQQL